MFPTPRFAKIFEAAGLNTFPSAFSYQLRKSRVLQTAFFEFSGCPHPHAGIYFGRRKASISENFGFPLLAAGPEIADCPILVNDQAELAAAAGRFNPLIVSEYVPPELQLLLIFVNYECNAVIAYTGSEKRVPLQEAGKPLPPGFSSFAAGISKLLRAYGIHDIAVESGACDDKGWWIESFKMPPFSWLGPSGGIVRRHEIVSNLIKSNKL